MSGNQHLEYHEIQQALQCAATSVDASDIHGFLSGMICASGFADSAVWSAEVFGEYNAGDLLQRETFQLIQRLYEHTLSQMNSPDLDFELLIPGDDEALADRTESLGHWCLGFLSGLTMGGLPPKDQLSDEVRDLLEDFSGISNVDFEIEEGSEEDAAALEEVVEYLRVGALFLLEELQPAKAPARLQ